MNRKILDKCFMRECGLTTELTHAGPEDAAREAELSAPSGVVCSDLVGLLHTGLLDGKRCPSSR